MPGKPDADLEITEELVRDLIAEQFPRYAALELEWAGGGWDNEMYRLGDDLAVRLPRRAMGADLIAVEQRWLPRLADRLPIATPAPVAIGQASPRFPWSFSIVPWFGGDTADVSPPAASEAERIAAFLLALHEPAPTTAPTSPVRGVPLPELARRVDELLSRAAARDTIEPEPLAAVWRNGLAAGAAEGRRWLHGDLHAQNFIVDDRRLVAVIDWSDLCAGDPATDLVAIWSLFDDAAVRRRLLTEVATDAAMQARGAAWAAYFGLLLIDAGEVNSAPHARQGYTLVERLYEDLGSNGTAII